MKKWLFFGGGILVGVILTIAVLAIIGVSKQNNGGLIGATFFEQPSQTFNDNSFEVMQVIQDHAALVRGKESPDYTLYLGPIYLMWNNSGRYYYDKEIIQVPEDCKVVQIGIYKYTTGIGISISKTVPIIGIIDK